MDIIVVHNKVEIYSFLTPIKLPFGKLTNSSYSNFKMPVISPKQNMQSPIIYNFFSFVHTLTASDVL